MTRSDQNLVKCTPNLAPRAFFVIEGDDRKDLFVSFPRPNVTECPGDEVRAPPGLDQPKDDGASVEAGKNRHGRINVAL